MWNAMRSVILPHSTRGSRDTLLFDDLRVHHRVLTASCFGGQHRTGLNRQSCSHSIILRRLIPLKQLLISANEAGAGIEPANSGFAARDLTTWLPRRCAERNYRVQPSAVNAPRFTIQRFSESGYRN